MSNIWVHWPRRDRTYGIVPVNEITAGFSSKILSALGFLYSMQYIRQLRFILLFCGHLWSPHFRRVL